MTLKNVQDCLLLSYMEGFLDEEEFCALYDVTSTDYPVFEHGKYRRFDLNGVSEKDCFSRFRFIVLQIHRNIFPKILIANWNQCLRTSLWRTKNAF